MVQDFAKSPKVTNDGPLPPATGSAAPAWGLLLTGLVTGLALGLFIGFLAYISGVLPTLPGHPAPAMASVSEQASQDAGNDVLTEELERAAARLQLEFYRELPNYEVVVDATPLDLPPSQRPQPAAGTDADSSAGTATEPRADVAITTPAPTQSGGAYMIQAGAFQQANSAQAQRDRLLALGVDAQVKQEALLGRTLYLVQTGPYAREQAVQIERILRNSNIDSMRITLANR